MHSQVEKVKRPTTTVGGVRHFLLQSASDEGDTVKGKFKLKSRQEWNIGGKNTYESAYWLSGGGSDRTELSALNPLVAVCFRTIAPSPRSPAGNCRAPFPLPGAPLISQID